MRMKAAALVACLALAVGTPGALAASDELREDMNFAKSKVYPALVNIQVVSQSFSAGRSQKFPAAGSGVIVSPAGHVLTNFHVAGDTTRIVCTLPSRETIDAEVVAHDPLTDLSVLKLKLENRRDVNQSLPFATLGDSDALKVGDYVLAMGNPLTLSSSMTLGIVSNTKRVFTDFTGTELEEMDLGEGQMTGFFTRWIQHDALILPGNSGGPLVNLRGEVVGINELGGSGVGFAIPSNLAANVLNQALTHGEVRRGWFGVSLMPVGKLDRNSGSLVSWVVQDGPAYAAGIRAGDILLSVNGEPLDLLVFEEVPLAYRLLADFTAGQEVAVRYLRGGEEHVAGVAVVPMEKYLDDEEELRNWGLTVRGVTSHMALARKFPDGLGVLVTGVRPGRPAAEAKPMLEVDDVIIAVDGRTIHNRRDFIQIAGELAGQEEVSVTLRRKDENIITVLALEEEEPEFEGGELPKAWIGIKTQVLTPKVAATLNLDGRSGFRVTQVYPGTAAAEAGLATGDVIVALHGKPLNASRVQDSEMLERRIESLSIGSMAAFTLVRNGAEVNLEVVLEETPASAADVKTAKDDFLELAVRELTFMDRVKNKWGDEVAGVLVADASRGGWASLAGLRGNDLIVSIEDAAVPDVKTFESVLKTVKTRQSRYVTVFARREYKTVFLFMEPDWSQYEEKED